MRASSLAAAAGLACASCALGPPVPGGFAFGVMGDTPYSLAQEPRFVAMIAHMDREPLAFSIHVGDIKAGGHSPCTDALYERRLAQFDAAKHPVVYTPGDNEWTDCREPSSGAMDPLERLARLREVFFRGRTHLGAGTLDTEGEGAPGPGCGEYPENRLWEFDGVRFATINVPGPDNNEGHDAASDAEARCRNAANHAWIERAVEGKRVGDTVRVQLEPEDAFGEYDAELLRVEPRERFPKQIEVGMRFEGVPGDREDEALIYTVTDVTPESVVVDGNHPLAGERLWFRCKVSGVRAATAEELRHGHVHGDLGVHPT